MDVPGVALITGAASGIGAACARTFARDGCSGLALVDVNTAGLEALKAEIQSAHTQRHPNSSPLPIETYICNVTDETQVNATITAAATALQRLDYVVNAAGIGKKHAGGVSAAPTAEWQAVIDINLTGSFFVLRAASQVMLTQTPLRSSLDGRELQRGAIVNFGSILGAVGVPLSTAYTAAKHGVLGLTRTASEDLAAKGVRVNAICPGYTETPMTMGDELIKKAMDERVANMVPSKDSLSWVVDG